MMRERGSAGGKREILAESGSSDERSGGLGETLMARDARPCNRYVVAGGRGAVLCGQKRPSPTWSNEINYSRIFFFFFCDTSLDYVG